VSRPQELGRLANTAIILFCEWMPFIFSKTYNTIEKVGNAKYFNFRDNMPFQNIHERGFDSLHPLQSSNTPILKWFLSV
jgi:hypothetical protein